MALSNANDLMTIAAVTAPQPQLILAAAATPPAAAAAPVQVSATPSGHASSGKGGGAGMCDEKTVEYLRDLIAEKQILERDREGVAVGVANGGGGGGKSVLMKLLDQGRWYEILLHSKSPKFLKSHC